MGFDKIFDLTAGVHSFIVVMKKKKSQNIPVVVLFFFVFFSGSILVEVIVDGTLGCIVQQSIVKQGISVMQRPIDMHGGAVPAMLLQLLSLLLLPLSLLLPLLKRPSPVRSPSRCFILHRGVNTPILLLPCRR